LRIFEFLAAIAAGYFSQTFWRGIFFSIDSGLNRIRRRSGGIIFAGFDA